MVEEKEGEERSKSGSSAAPSLSLKGVLNGVKPNIKKSSDSSSDRYPLRLRNPDLSNCHVCDSQISCKGGKSKLQTLDSHWRIVIICDSCFKNVQSAKVCSYCFTEISEMGISCGFCNRRVHGECMSMYSQLNSCPSSGSFTCIDCWIPRSLNKIDNKRYRIASNSSSSRPPRVSSKCSESLEDVAKDAKSTAEIKVANAARAREKATVKAAAARKAAEMAANALNLAVAAATEESQINGSCPVGDDAKLALRLHRAINSSPRIFRHVRSNKLDCLVDPSKLGSADWQLEKHSDNGNRIVSNLEVGSDILILGKLDKASSEPSLQMVNLDHGSSNDLGSVEAITKTDSRGSPEECNRTSEVGRTIKSTMVSDVGRIKISDCQDCTVDPTMKEEQASCSSKVSISWGNYNCTNSGSQICQSKNGLIHYVRSNKRGSRLQPACRTDSSVPEAKVCHCMPLEPAYKTRLQPVYKTDSSVSEAKVCRGSDVFWRVCRGSDMFLKKYRRRFRAQNLFTRTYSRSSKLKRLLHQNSSSCHNAFHIESQSSGTLPLMQVNNTEVLTSYEAFQHPSAQSRDSTPSSSQS